MRVWDPLVRVFHWSLVAAFFIAYFTEEDLLAVHTVAGYTVLGLLGIRLIWGLVGSRHARFTDFVYRPRVVLSYLKDVAALRARRYLGHNPAGGAMVILILLSLVATGFTGMGIYGVEHHAGPLAGWLANAGHNTKELFEESHEFFANFTLFLVILHVAGVLVESLLHRENLVRSMFTGSKPVRDEA
ncbi:MAG TPA: cytochrome b/b6 domain-containing protein [Gammaproteobacteria bacterium]|nr:cytochrome b/b6 domain-containing protein [Gammaproteobacteria bacterium]